MAAIKFYSTTIDCRSPEVLARFYAALLGWEVVYCDGTFACVGAPGQVQGGYPGLSFQREPAYQPPVWPTDRAHPQQMAHLDFAVDDLEEAVRQAVACGAVQATQQFSEGWRVMLDPEGHPFCLCAMGEMMRSPQFALR